MRQAKYKIKANAFASAFYFFPLHKPNSKKIKRACKQSHTTRQGFLRTTNEGVMNVIALNKQCRNFKQLRLERAVAVCV
jgi:hypothetical protein